MASGSTEDNSADRKYTCRHYTFGNYTCKIDAFRREYLQDRIPAELKTCRNKTFKLKYLQLWIPADLNTCSIEKPAELNACEIKYLRKRIEYLQNQIPAELNTIRIIFMENQLPNGGNCQKNPNILHKDQSTQMTSEAVRGCPRPFKAARDLN